MTEGGQASAWRYGYDEQGRLRTVVVPVPVCTPDGPCHDNASRLTYEPSGRVITYERDAGHPGRFEFDEAGRLTSAALGVTYTYRYDDRGRVIEIESSSEIGPLERLAYEGRCPAAAVQRFMPDTDPLGLVHEPPLPDAWPAWASPSDAMPGEPRP